mgnify:CR=1 FL=1
MINTFKGAYIVTIKNYFTAQLFHLIYNLLMLHHYNNKVDIGKEGIQIVVLMLNYILRDIRVIAF